MSSKKTQDQQRSIQKDQDQSDEARQSAQAGQGGKSGSKGGSKEEAQPLQAGAREQPSKLPAQHLEKPGREADLALAPRFLAPDYKGSGKLQDQVALITGADSGIGRSVAVLYAREGADVAIVYLSEDEDARETQRHIEAEGRQCLLIRGDVQERKFCEDAVRQTVERFGQLDILVNNAAFQEHADSLEDLTEERLELTFRTNIFGYFHMAQAALPHLKEGSAIVNTGSVVGLQGSGTLLDYASTKGAIHAFTKSLAQNLLPKGIRVNAVAPGPVWTPLNPADAPAEKVAQFGSSADVKRAAQPEELSPAYVFLASKVCAGYITGIVLPVTGSIGAI
jgi:NAD(P)-dependent dehydrogenase (short-subunit alcohol dehydrogenase family)